MNLCGLEQRRKPTWRWQPQIKQGLSCKQATGSKDDAAAFMVFGNVLSATTKMFASMNLVQ